MPRECTSAFRSARAGVETDSAMRTSALRPSAIGPVRCRVPLRKKRDDASVTQTSSDRLRVITAVAQHGVRTMARTPALSLQGRGLHQPVQELPVNRYGWLG